MTCTEKHNFIYSETFEDSYTVMAFISVGINRMMFYKTV